MEKGFIGIDLGTSAVKLLLMDETGHILKTVSKEYPISFPKPGWSEQNPYDWFEQLMVGMKELIAGCEEKIEGISFGGQMHGLVVLDAEDQVIRPAILWNDGRTGEECVYLNETVGRDVISAETGNIAFAGFTAPKLLWMKKNEPENFAKIEKIMLPKDYLAYRLTGVHATDASDASGMLLYDVKNRKWSAKMCELCGVREEQLAKVFESYEVIGNVKEDLAAELGIRKEVRVIAGAGDNAAAAIGTGTVSDGDCNISLGTSGTIFIASDSFSVDDRNALHSFAHATGSWHLMGCMLSAASCNKWWMEDILKEPDMAAAQAEICAGSRGAGTGGQTEAAPAGVRCKALGRNHVYFLPYLMGERSPHNDPAARGAFIGMSMDTTRADMLQAVLEGVAFGLRDSLEVARSSGLKIEKTKICGGGAKSPLWRKMIANIMNLTVETIEAEEGPALGGALLAAVGCGVFKDTKEAADAVVRVTGEEVPDPELVALYEERYQTFRKLYPALKDVYGEL
ncbi:MAG: xylulokinase [Eubacterium sp.]|nr:xylulokinase [Eubacterium sp.]